MTSHCKANNIKGIRQAGRAGWEALVVYAMTVPGIPASGLELLGLPVRNARQREAKKALEALCQDACKKIRSRDLQLTVRANQQRNSTDAAAGVIRAADGGIVAPHVGSPPQSVANQPSVVVYIIDPADNNCYTATDADPRPLAIQPVRWGKWDLGPQYRARFVLQSKSLEEVYRGVKSKIPAGRTIRAIYGCVVRPATGVVINPDVDLEHLTTDTEFAAFLQDTASKPVALQVYLKHNKRADTPAPDGLGYFATDHFELEEKELWDAANA
ncbi:hypothetical protein BDZ91DRAFT_766059 [Kalaharituber pfeilii]|nr:hypothetical protein BDZ91DRAFT_766059 [Kalaharituber pfeilii]